MLQILFYIFSLLLLLSAIMVVTVRNPVHAVLFLVLAFFASAAIWLLLQAEFLAIALVLVYVGAVMVLFLFVVMMLDINIVVLREGFSKFLPVGIIVALLMATAMGVILTSAYFNTESFNQAVTYSADHSNAKALGYILFTEYLFQFEIAGAILLVAIVAAIALSLRDGDIKRHKSIDPAEQVIASKKDRLRIVDIDKESGV